MQYIESPMPESLRKFKNTTTKGKEKRGLFILSLYPYITGGQEIFNYYFLTSQYEDLKRKHFYWTFNNLPGYDEFHLKINAFKPIRLFYPLQLLITLLKYRKKINFIYTNYARQTWLLPLILGIYFKIFRIPYVITIHSGGEPQWKFKFPYIFYFKNAAALIGVSEAICADYGKYLPGIEISFIPPLVPFHKVTDSNVELREKYGFKPADRILLYVGSIKKMKNPDKILKALLLIDKSLLTEKCFKINFVGGGDMLEEIKQFTVDNSLSEWVIFSGLTHRDLIPDYYAISDYYIISSDYEGTSVSLLEAMYNSLPIIAADSPGINDMLINNETALLYRPNEIEDLAKCIVTLISNNDLAIELASKAHEEYLKNYSYESMIQQYEEIFDKISA